MNVRQVGVLDYLLHCLEPDMLFVEMLENAWCEGLKLEVLCFALRIHKTVALPVLEGEAADSIPDVATALSQHYNNIGKPLSQPEKLTPEIIKKGYFHINTDKKITCILDDTEDKTQIDFSNADQLMLHDLLGHETALTMVINGRKTKVESLYEEFESESVVFPSRNPEWQSEMIVCNDDKPSTTPSKSRSSTRVAQARRQLPHQARC